MSRSVTRPTSRQLRARFYAACLAAGLTPREARAAGREAVQEGRQQAAQKRGRA